MNSTKASARSIGGLDKARLGWLVFGHGSSESPAEGISAGTPEPEVEARPRCRARRGCYSKSPSAGQHASRHASRLIEEPP
jgi:hypothetical protein